MTILVVVPTLNEAAHIQRVLGELLTDLPAEPTRVVVVDGGSTDGTREAVAGVDDDRVSVIHNPARLQAAAVNLAVREAGEDVDVFVRADSHSSYPPGFVKQVVATLRAHVDEGCASVVVPMRTVGTTPFQHAVAETQNSLLGNGGSAHRRGGFSGYIDHGHHAAMLRSAFESVGGYDANMVANEDAELDERLRSAGYRIYLDGDAQIVYFPRATPRGLWHQYYRYGVGRASTILRHRARPKARQLAPLAVTVVNSVALAASAKDRRALAVPAAYVGACLALAGRSAAAQRDPRLLLMAPAAMIQHQAWGIGFLRRMGREITSPR